MNLENEILGIRTSLGRIEGRMDEIGKLSERVSTLEQSQAWLKGAWTVLAAACATSGKPFTQSNERLKEDPCLNLFPNISSGPQR